MTKITSFRDIPQLTQAAPYMVNTGWDYMFAKDGWLANQCEAREGMSGLDLKPDFQRGHVWTEEQQISYVEYRLRGGEMSGRHIFFNHPGWMKNWKGTFVIVDGLQRLTAARRFMQNEIKAFGSYFNEYEDGLRLINVDFIVCVNTLKTRAAVLRWYLEMNAGGTPHSAEEIARVTELYRAEVEKEA